MRPGAVPRGWATAPLGDLCLFNPKHSPDLPDALSVSFVPMASIDDQSGRISSTTTVSLREVWSGFTHFADGDVIFAKITPSMENGKCAVVRNLLNGLGCGSTEFFVLRPLGGILPEYLHFYLRQRSFRRNAAVSMTGAVGQQRVPRTFLENTEIPVAPLSEQKRIIAQLATSKARADNASRMIEGARTRLVAYRRTLISTGIRGVLPGRQDRGQSDSSAKHLVDELRIRRREAWALAGRAESEYIEPPASPKPSDGHIRLMGPSSASWGRTTLEALTDPTRGISYGIVQTGDPDPTGIPTVRGGDVKGFRIDTESLKRVTPSIEERYGRTRLRGREVLITIRGTVGGVAVAGPGLIGSNVSREVAVIPLLEGVVPEYIAYLLGSPAAQDILNEQVKGVAQSGINLSDLKQFPVPLPPSDAQRQIVAAIRSGLHRADRFESHCDSLLQQMENLREALASAAYRGELTLQSDSEASGHTVVERARAEKEQAMKEIKSVRRRPRGVSSSDEPEPAPTPPVGAEEKTRRDVPVGYLRSLLDARQLSAITALELYRLSGMSIDEFYKQLASELGDMALRESKQKGHVEVCDAT
ncbi:hypothetical protein E2C06_08050 [Dankookia rubra]|uniref:Type I restriction modification DNA specificity domain-containing protein n=1 Tax=Dankookia rubra TaxID=1442381 RepID=A0A4R5QKN1_9PROT|nr:restriction endonuclease subunit S [Dankookia rubra]TDH63311.1 hypothetical protein E2C06_08050 [Dankookia rubra]